MAFTEYTTIDELNNIFRFHRLFGSGTSFTDVLDTKRFMACACNSLDPLIPRAVFGGAITYGIPTTFESIDNPFYLLLYIEKGNALIITKNSITMPEGSMRLLSPYENFRFDTTNTPCYFHLFLLSGESLRLYTDHSSIVIEFKEKHIGTQLSYLQRLLLQRGSDSELLRARILTDILTEAHLAGSKVLDPTPATDIPGYLQEMKSILDREYNTFITLDNLERRLFVSKYRLCREFKYYYGHSPLQYLNNVRIQQAKTLLKQTDITVTAVGYDVGITNTSHFIKLFKRETAQTPAEYRKNKSS